jgi:hypothetical protein
VSPLTEGSRVVDMTVEGPASRCMRTDPRAYVGESPTFVFRPARMVDLWRIEHQTRTSADRWHRNGADTRPSMMFAALDVPLPYSDERVYVVILWHAQLELGAELASLGLSTALAVEVYSVGRLGGKVKTDLQVVEVMRQYARLIAQGDLPVAPSGDQDHARWSTARVVLSGP